MEVTEVKVKLVEENRDRLKAYCTMTVDNEFVVRDLKLIEGSNGLFVAMPSRKLADRCHKCGSKNHLRSRFCNNCGGRLDENRAGTDREGRPKLHADIAHPINSQCREKIQRAIQQAYELEVERSKEPGYRPVSLDEDDFEDYDTEHASRPGRGEAAANRKKEAAPERKKESSFGEGVL